MIDIAMTSANHWGPVTWFIWAVWTSREEQGYSIQFPSGLVSIFTSQWRSRRKNSSKFPSWQQ